MTRDDGLAAVMAVLNLGGCAWAGWLAYHGSWEPAIFIMLALNHLRVGGLCIRVKG